MPEYEIREMGYSERINDDQGNPIVYPMQQVCPQCACKHEHWINYIDPSKVFSLWVCLDCDHRWSERTHPLSEVNY